MIRLVRARRPNATLFLSHCPMVPGGGGDWLAANEQIANPYFGSQMLRCGTVKETIAPGGISDSDRFVEGFFCPVFPDRLYEKPQHCPLDKFPMKRVRVEKVAAGIGRSTPHTPGGLSRSAPAASR
jgi:hypothetical protein